MITLVSFRTSFDFKHKQHTTNCRWNSTHITGTKQKCVNAWRAKENQVCGGGVQVGWGWLGPYAPMHSSDRFPFSSTHVRLKGGHFIEQPLSTLAPTYSRCIQQGRKCPSPFSGTGHEHTGTKEKYLQRPSGFPHLCCSVSPRLPPVGFERCSLI